MCQYHGDEILHFGYLQTGSGILLACMKAYPRFNHDGKYGTTIYVQPWHGWSCRNRSWGPPNGTPPLESRNARWPTTGSYYGPADAPRCNRTRRSSGFPSRTYDAWYDARRWTARPTWSWAKCTRIVSSQSTLRTNDAATTYATSLYVYCFICSVLP